MANVNNTDSIEDEYLIILQRDEFDNDKEFEQTIKLNRNVNFYFYERNEYIDDNTDYFELSIGLLLRKLNKMISLFEISDSIKLSIKFGDPRVLLEESLSILESFVSVKMEALTKKVKYLKTLIGTYFNQRVEFRININIEDKIHKLIDFINFIMENGSKNKSSNNNFVDKNEIINAKYEDNQNKNFVNKENGHMENQSTDNTSERDNANELVEDIDAQIGDLQECISNEDSVDESDDRISINDSCSDIFDLEESNSEISQKSEPIINQRNKLNLYKKAGTVINGGVFSGSSEKLDREKYLKLIESYKDLTKTNEVKENLDTNQLKT